VAAGAGEGKSVAMAAMCLSICFAWLWVRAGFGSPRRLVLSGEFPYQGPGESETTQILLGPRVRERGARI
jgi:hypothetical protein